MPTMWKGRLLDLGMPSSPQDALPRHECPCEEVTPPAPKVEDLVDTDDGPSDQTETDEEELKE